MMRRFAAYKTVSGCLRVILCVLTSLAIVISNGLTLSSTVGTHCPTASVQTVRENILGEMIARKPKLGEKAFVQCHCAEKKAAPATEAVTTASKEIMVAALPVSLTLNCPTLLMNLSTTFLAPLEGRSQNNVLPSIPPPNFI